MYVQDPLVSAKDTTSERHRQREQAGREHRAKLATFKEKINTLQSDKTKLFQLLKQQ